MWTKSPTATASSPSFDHEMQSVQDGQPLSTIESRDGSELSIMFSSMFRRGKFFSDWQDEILSDGEEIFDISYLDLTMLQLIPYHPTRSSNGPRHGPCKNTNIERRPSYHDQARPVAVYRASKAFAHWFSRMD